MSPRTMAGATNVFCDPGMERENPGRMNAGSTMRCHRPLSLRGGSLPIPRAIVQKVKMTVIITGQFGWWSLYFSTSLLPVEDSMITFLEGILEEALPTQIVVNVGGIGYQVIIPMSSFDRLPPPGNTVRILTQLVVREDAHLLYGFATREERDLFLLLTHHVSGVGPKLALAVLSGMSVMYFKAAVVAGDIAVISKIRGVGKKTAERVVLELKDKLGVAAEWEASSAVHAPSAQDIMIHDAVLALISLGYKQVDAHKAVKKLIDSAPNADMTTEQLVRDGLKLLI